MADLWTAEDVELVAQTILFTDWATDSPDAWVKVPDATRVAYQGRARAVLAALAEAGRLLPAGTYTEEEYQFGTEARTVWVGPWRPVPDIEDET